MSQTSQKAPAKKTYARPEVLELGKAEALTLGSIGCAPDSFGCDRFKTNAWEERR